MASLQTFPFLKLFPELREMIYSHCVFNGAWTPLTLCCRQIHAELSPLCKPPTQDMHRLEFIVEAAPSPRDRIDVRATWLVRDNKGRLGEWTIGLNILESTPHAHKNHLLRPVPEVIPAMTELVIRLIGVRQDSPQQPSNPTSGAYMRSIARFKRVLGCIQAAHYLAPPALEKRIIIIERGEPLPGRSAQTPLFSCEHYLDLPWTCVLRHVPEFKWLDPERTVGWQGRHDLASYDVICCWPLIIQSLDDLGNDTEPEF